MGQRCCIEIIGDQLDYTLQSGKIARHRLRLIEHENQLGYMQNGEFLEMTNFVFTMDYAIDAESPGVMVTVTRKSDGKTG